MRVCGVGRERVEDVVSVVDAGVGYEDVEAVVEGVGLGEEMGLRGPGGDVGVDVVGVWGQGVGGWLQVGEDYVVGVGEEVVG